MLPSLFIKPICFLALLLGLVFGALHLRNVVYQDGYAAAVAVETQAHNAALKKRDAENDAARLEFAAAAQSQKESYEKELSDVRAAGAAVAARRVPIRAALCQPAAAGAGQAADAGRAAPAAAGGEFLPDALAGDLRQLAIKADETLAQARSMQEAAVKSGCFEVPP